MTRKDKLLKDYLTHPLIHKKYSKSDAQLPNNIREGLRSDSPIIKAIAHIINEVEGYPSKSEVEVDRSIRKLLNESPL